jgi:hypothetical protein
MDMIIAGATEMEKKTFAFKLADHGVKPSDKWKAREGVALAGCTETYPGSMNYRAAFIRSDNWVYC